VTTQKLLGDGVPILLPEWARWRDALRSDAAFARRLTEELLRLVTPTRYLARYASHDLEFSGDDLERHRFRKGERAILFLEAANRDPNAFPEPHRFGPARQPNAHLAFGFGPHRCPGASVARVEIQIALEELLTAFDELKPSPSASPTYEPNPNLGGFASYPCVCR
jgi:pimeloyl-[acyl-carrier protein] synthase